MADRDRSVHLAAEGSFGVDPDADGSDYQAIQATSAPYPEDGQQFEESNYAIGRNHLTELIPTKDGGRLDLEVFLTGFATSGGDGDAAPAQDALDLIFTSAFGTPNTHAGEGLAAGGTASNMVLDTDLANLVLGSLAPVYVAADSRAYWRPISTDSGTATYGITPDWETTPAATDLKSAVREWYVIGDVSAAGASIASLVRVSGVLHRLLGGRPSGAITISMVGGTSIRVKAPLVFDSWETGATAANLPVITTFPSPAKGTRSPIYFDGAEIQTKNVTLELRLNTLEDESPSGANGRADYRVISVDPLVTFDLAYDPATYHGLLRAGTTAPVLIQFGRGLSTGRMNTLAFHAPALQLESVAENSDGGWTRHTVKGRVIDPGSSTARLFTLARC